MTGFPGARPQGARPPRSPVDRSHRDRPDDAGGIWIVTGWVGGAVLYAGIVVMAVAGFTAVVPLVVIPPVLVALIGGNSLLGGGRGGSAARPPAGTRVPLAPDGPDSRAGPGTPRPDSRAGPGTPRPDGADAGEKPGDPR